MHFRYYIEVWNAERERWDFVSDDTSKANARRRVRERSKETGDQYRVWDFYEGKDVTKAEKRKEVSK